MPEKQPLPSADTLFVAQLSTAAGAALLVLARAPDWAIVAATVLSLLCITCVPVSTYRVAAVHRPPSDRDRHQTLGHRGPWLLSRRLPIAAWLAGSVAATALAELLIQFPAEAPSNGVVLLAASQPIGLLGAVAAIIVGETMGHPPAPGPSSTPEC